MSRLFPTLHSLKSLPRSPPSLPGLSLSLPQAGFYSYVTLVPSPLGPKLENALSFLYLKSFDVCPFTFSFECVIHASLALPLPIC